MQDKVFDFYWKRPESHLVHQSWRIFEKKQVFLSQPDNVARTQLDLVPQKFPVPRDCSVLTGVDHERAASSVPMQVAVLWKDVSGREEDVSFGHVFRTALVTNDDERGRQQVDDEVLRGEMNGELQQRLSDLSSVDVSRNGLM